MQKKLIALAVAGAFVAPAAFADSGNVTIYGVMDASFDVVDSGTSTAGNSGNRQNHVSSNSSRLGFKGTEDLGNGLAAVWQVESTVNVDGGAGTTIGGRNTFVGLSSKTMGTAILGRHDTPYKLATRSLDVFGDGIADNRSIMGGGSDGAAASFDGRQSNVLAYISPTWNGFHAAIGYVTFENANNAHFGDTRDTQDKAWSLAGIYGNGPWFASLAYEKHYLENLASTAAVAGVWTPIGAATNVLAGTVARVNANGAEEHAWKLGVGYKANNFRVGVAYENTSDNLGAGNTDAFGHHAWYLGGGYTFGNNEVKLAYTKAGDMGNTANTGANQWTVGIDHNFSKRTKVYALYTKLNNDNAVSYTLQGGSTAAAVNGAGSDPHAWSFGMRHNF